MKKKNLLLLAMMAFGLSLVFTACDKDDDEDDTPAAITGEALFSFVADGKTVTFTNESDVSGVVSYAWDFGDSNTSTEKDPVHTYELKGDYNVTLTVTDAQSGTHPISTSVKVDKKTRINLTDNSFADWDAVTEAEFIVNCGDNSGTVIATKFDYDANYIYSYTEMEGTLDDIFTMFMDVDANLPTGFTSFLWPLAGNEYLLQGQVTNSEIWLECYEYTGPGGDDWSWEFKELPEGFFVIGNVTEDAGIVKFEMGYSRELIPGFSNDQVKLGIYISDAGWAEVGFAPDKMEEEGEETDSFLIDMR